MSPFFLYTVSLGFAPNAVWERLKPSTKHGKIVRIAILWCHNIIWAAVTLQWFDG